MATVNDSLGGPVDEAWAKNLVGRDWEIFWEASETQEEEKTNGQNKSSKNNSERDDHHAAVTVDSSMQRDHPGAIQQPHVTSAAGDDESEDSEEDEPFVADWYDAHIVGFNSDTQKFQVKFVGDEESYEMTLRRSIVRPNVRAWIDRTWALLSSPKTEADSVRAWGESLPNDTSTIEDEAELANLKSSTFELTGQSLSSSSSDDDVPFETIRLRKEKDEVLWLMYLVRSQILLRSKLALITDPEESGSVSESYLNYLLQCLQRLEDLCVWYVKCYELYERLLGGGASDESPKIEVDYIRNECLEHGRALIAGMVSLDLSPGGAKKRQQTTPLISSVRRKKRRKGYKASGFLMSRTDYEQDEGGRELEDIMYELECHRFMPSRECRRLISHLEEAGEVWSVRLFASMLLRICIQIQDPVAAWTREADSIILTAEDESDESEEEHSEQEKNHIETSAPEQAKENDEDESMEDQKERLYSYSEIQSFAESTSSTRLLRQVNLGAWLRQLEGKLAAIELFESKAWAVITHLFDEIGDHTKDSDDLLASLTRFKDDAESSNNLKNVHPLGGASSKMTREVIDDAIAVRAWLLDLKHAERGRERVAFVQTVVSRGTNLPFVPNPLEAESSMKANMSDALGRVQRMSERLYSNLTVSSRYERLISETQDGSTREEGLVSLPGVAEALGILSKIPVISIGEEKLRVRHSVLSLAKSIQELKQDDSFDYPTIARLKTQLDSIKTGKPSYRMELVCGLEKNDAVDAEMQEFAVRDLLLFCDREASWLDEVFSRATSWKEKTDSIILFLRTQGNSAAGSLLRSPKPVHMVDLKRIEDLLNDKEALEVSFPNETSILASIRDQCAKWNADLESVIANNDNVLPVLKDLRDNRPKGLVMEPPRHSVDLWISFLEWRQRVVDGLTLMATTARNDSQHLTKQIIKIIHPLLVEGADILEAFSQPRDNDGEYKVSSESSIAILTGLSENLSSVRPISRSKLESLLLGRTLFNNIISPSVDTSAGEPLLALLYLQWHAAVLDLVERLDTVEGSNRPTLESAAKLSSARPVVVSTDSLASTLSSAKTPEVARLHMLVQDGKEKECLARNLLSTTTDVARGSFAKADSVRKRLTELKDIQSDFKARVKRGQGLLLDSSLERSLDQTIKDLGWLVRTLPYASLHFDDVDQAREEAVNQGQDGKSIAKTAIPWDVLVSLYERDPSAKNDRLGGDVARVSLRVNELYEAAIAWQDEVTSQMSLSFRGGAKRRVQEDSTGPEEEAGSKLDLGRLAQLAKHPILSRVAMPREDAVKSVLTHARDFERLFLDLLDKDFEGKSSDKAPYPGSTSLIGHSGQFIIYRLTGSELFVALKSALDRLGSLSTHILADTPGKAAFLWIAKAVQWTESLRDAVVITPPFGNEGPEKLAIRYGDARRLLEHGNNLFLEITEELRKTLSDHRIYLSTNKQTEKLTVVIGKSGAHHSLGGTLIRWCPLLLECLKADCSKMSQWDLHVNQTVTLFQREAAPIMTSYATDTDSVYQVYSFHERIQTLLDEARHHLVIVPRVETINGLLNLQRSLDSWAARRLSQIPGVGVSVNALKKRCFEDAFMVVDNRFPLLDALLNRRRLDGSSATKKPKITDVPIGTSFRDKARSILEKALRKGMKIMGIDETDSSSTNMTHYCAMKAWEMENAVYAAYQGDAGDREVAEQYRDKVRSLRHNLEDLKNPTLCPRVLLGDIEMERLVVMSPEELASKQVRQTRAKAEQEGRKNVTLHAGATTKKTQGLKSIIGAKLKTTGLFDPSPMPTKPLASTPLSQMPIRTSSNDASKMPPAPPVVPPLDSASPLLETPSVDSPGGAPLTEEQDADVTAAPSSTEVVRPLVVAPGTKRPSAPTAPPPPSLAAVAAAVTDAPPAPTSSNLRSSPTEGTYVNNRSGGDIFALTVNKIKFKAAFKQEDNSATIIMDGTLPASLKEKGRLSVDEFSSFVSQKMRTGRWAAIALRLSPADDVSTKEYKRYYKEYESNKKPRIAMIAVGDDKMFLVTPKFQKACKELRGLFRSSSSTYGIILKRKRQFS